MNTATSPTKKWRRTEEYQHCAGKLYDELSENRHHYSKFKTSPSQMTEVESVRRAQDERLMLDANEYAIALGVRDPKYLAGIVTPEDLEEFRTH